MRLPVLASLLIFAAWAGDPLVERGYAHFYNLEYDEAIADFQAAIALHPNDPELHNHLAETIVFQEMYRDGALESELVSGNNSFLRRPKLNPTAQTEKWFLSEVGKAMALAQARIDKNPKDAAALYALGISYGLRSNYYWVVKKAWHDSLKDATAARRAARPGGGARTRQRGRAAGGGTARLHHRQPSLDLAHAGLSARDARR